MNMQTHLQSVRYPLPLPVERPLPHAPADFRRFTLRWNSRKVRDSRRRADEWQECQGVQFSAHEAVSRIVLSNGLQFGTLAEMREMLESGGDFAIEWLDN